MIRPLSIRTLALALVLGASTANAQVPYPSKGTPLGLATPQIYSTSQMNACKCYYPQGYCPFPQGDCLMPQGICTAPPVSYPTPQYVPYSPQAARPTPRVAAQGR